MRVLVFDLEADGLLQDASRIHCACVGETILGNQYLTLGPEEVSVERLLELLREVDVIVGHNIIDYDLPLLMKLYGFQKPSIRIIDGKILNIVDTALASRLYWPDLVVPRGWTGQPAPHSIEAWAMRFGGEQKIPIDDWSKRTEEMVERCLVDVTITSKLFFKIYNESPSSV